MRGTLRAKRSDAEVVGMQVAQRWLDCHGQQARAWLDQVPDIARSWAKRWKFAIGEPLHGGSVSIVYSVKYEDGPAVLKLAAPWSRWPREEVGALRAWNGNGAIRLLVASDDARALLLERVCPGTPATGMTAAALADLLVRLSRPPVPPEMPSLADAVQLRFDRAQENRHELLSAVQIMRARCTAVELATTSQGSPVLCHGDLLSKNILLSDKRGVLAIDPNPCAGHAAYDAAQWAVTETPVGQAPQRATAIAAALGISPDDVFEWVCVLAGAEVCLAPLDRAKESLALARRFNAEWVRDDKS